MPSTSVTTFNCDRCNKQAVGDAVPFTMGALPPLPNKWSVISGVVKESKQPVWGFLCDTCSDDFDVFIKEKGYGGSFKGATNG